MSVDHMLSLDDYQPLRSLRSDADRDCYLATGPDQQPVRVTVFSESLSDSPQFRAAVRHDVPTLCSVRHFHLLQTLDWGESDGRLFVIAEAPEGDALSDRQLPPLEWDQIVDIAWQITSAVQHAHNQGLTHGQLTPDCIYVSPQIRAQVSDFALAAWQEAVTEISCDTLVRRQQDIRQLTEILNGLLALGTDDDAELADYRQLLDDIATATESLTARDIQRRLGQLLLQDSADEIEMIDQRAGISHAGRSLVDELFEPPYTPDPGPPPRSLSAASAWIEILCLVALAALLILGIWLASG